MKIHPTWRPPSPEQRITPPSSAASRETPFQELLDASEDKGAFGFAELGMFGRARASVASASPDTRSSAVEPLAEPPASAMNPTGTQETAMPAGISGSSSAAAGTTGHALIPIRSASIVPIHNDRGAATAISWPGAATRTPEPSARLSRGQSAEPARTASLEKRLQAAAGDGARLTVVTDAKAGFIRIVAASSSLTTDEVRDLRRLATRLAAANGFTLAGLTLNGVEVEPSQLD